MLIWRECTTAQLQTSGFNAQGIIHISSVMMEEEEERARGKRPIRSCREVGGRSDENSEQMKTAEQLGQLCAGWGFRGSFAGRACRENGSEEFVMMRRLRMELM